MFRLSNNVRFYNWRKFRSKWLHISYLLPLAIFVAIVWLVTTRRHFLSLDGASGISQDRFMKYQAEESRRSGPGEKGNGYTLTAEEVVKYKDINEKEGFNFAASEIIALDRSLPDYRSTLCKQRVYPEDLPKASVIIVYFNEAFSVIMRTAHSVINRTPPRYLEEVILLDDSSTRPELLDPLKEYISETWSDGVVKVIRTPERYGLIKAKLYGAERATGPVLVFLDAHCEAARGWAEPILNEIKEDPTRVICPIIGNINSEDLKFNAGGSFARGGFWWSMHFSWEGVPARDRDLQQSPAHAFRSPTMAGGLFAASKDFFFRIGAYDPDMEIWGGENLDLSFRAWMCHGSLLFHPCSLVGHIFRATHPYGFPDKQRDYHGLNSKRVAEVWMDEYKQYYYLFRRDLVNKDVGDLSERHAIRKRENCHDFAWYLDNVYPEKFQLDKNVSAFGSVRNPSKNYCLDVLNKDEKTGYPLGVYPCHAPMSAMNQIFSMTKAGQIRREGTCMNYDYHDPGKSLRMETHCNTAITAQLWDYDKDTLELKHRSTGFCLDTLNLKPEQHAQLRVCDHSDTQKWEWTNYYGNT